MHVDVVDRSASPSLLASNACSAICRGVGGNARAPLIPGLSGLIESRISRETTPEPASPIRTIVGLDAPGGNADNVSQLRPPGCETQARRPRSRRQGPRSIRTPWLAA